MAGPRGGPSALEACLGRDGGAGARHRARAVSLQQQSGAAAPQVITDKGTPFGDLLVPKLTASVTDGAVGVSVDSPVTVSAEDGVLGAVTMADEDGAPVAGHSAATA